MLKELNDVPGMLVTRYVSVTILENVLLVWEEKEKCAQ